MQIVPYLFLGGASEEAMTFYQQVLGGELQISRFSDMPDPEVEFTQEDASRVMHAQLVWDQGILMASDGCPSDPPRPMDGCSVMLSFDDLDRARQVYESLGEGGIVIMAWEPTFWARGFGMFKDRFGVSWMVNASASN